MHSQTQLEAYIAQNPMAVLSTIDANGHPYGSVIYIAMLSENTCCFITKNATQKFKNLQDNPFVSITIGNAHETSTLQANGKAYIIEKTQDITMAMQRINRIHALAPDWLPPLAKIQAGEYEVVGIKLANIRIGHFGGKKIGDSQIFINI